MGKKIFLGLLLCSLFTGEIFAQGIRFESTYEAARQEAVKQKKILFIDFYTVWCGPCKILKRDVFPLPEVGKFFNAHFVSVQLDAEKEGKALAEKYEISSYPTLLFLTPEGEVVNKAVGAVDAEKFINIGKKTLELLNDPNSLANLKKQYISKRQDEHFLSLYVKRLKQFGEDAHQAIDDYLKVQTAMKGRSSKMMEYLMNNSNYIRLGGEAEKIFNEQEEWYMKVATKPEEKKLKNFRSTMMRLTQGYALENRDPEMYKIFLDRWVKLKEKPYYQNYTALSLELLQLQGETKAYKKRAVHYLDSIVSSRSVEEVRREDQRRYEEYCRENPGGGMVAEAMRAGYKDLDAGLQVAAIIEVGSGLLKAAKKADFKRFSKWIEYGNAVLSDNFMIPNFQANVLYAQGKKAEAITAKQASLSLTKPGYRARLQIEKELEEMEKGTFNEGDIIVR